MFRFLQKMYERTKAGELGELLGSMSLLQDGVPADPAIEADWSEAVRYALQGGGPEALSLS
jgi:hypothetical protein